MTDDLAAFVAVRLDELKLAAKIASVEDAWGQLRQSIPREPGPLNRCHRLMEEGSPARALREVAAGRARLALMAEATAEMDKLLADETAGRVDQAMAIGRARAATVAVKHDAAVWSDHPEYRQEWKP